MGGLVLGSQLCPVADRWAMALEDAPSIPVAALVTAYYPVSHADVIVSKILEGYQRNGGQPRSNLKLVSMYVDQQHVHDMSRSMAQQYSVRICASIDEAITLGSDKVQVEGVLSIAEHGDYPLAPDTQQKMYPRRRFFDQTVAAFRRCGMDCPYLNDKHFSWRWEDAKAMVDTAAQMGFPILAGSTLPLTWRFPELELPEDCEIESALTIGYGPLEDYGFHALESHTCMIERRRGGEAGVSRIKVAMDEQIVRSKLAGEWSSELFAAARATMPGNPVDTSTWDPLKHRHENVRQKPAAFLLQHRDGLNSAVIMTAEYSGGFAFACKLKGRDEPLACWFKLQDWGPFGHFSYLLDAFEATIKRHQSAYPAERTLLTTGILDRCMQLATKGGGEVATPELDLPYRATPWPFANHPHTRLILPHH